MNNTDKSPRLGLPQLGLGVGLRHSHFQHILDHSPNIDWFEIVSENFMDDFGWSKHVLHQIAERYPIVMHGVSMSIGSSDPLDLDYLKRLKTLSKDVNSKWISDHLCWTGVNDQNSHDLLPMPLTEESLNHVSTRIKVVQDILEQPIIIENPSTYLEFTSSSIDEWDFLNELCSNTNCGLLIDVNNVYVSSRNHGFDPLTYIDKISHDSIVQVHLAGHTDFDTHCIDTHDQSVSEAVWSLYARLKSYTRDISTLLEWDANIPSFQTLITEINKAKTAIEKPIVHTTNLTDSNTKASNPIDFMLGAPIE